MRDILPPNKSAGANRRWRLQFRCRGSRRESAVAQLFSLALNIRFQMDKITKERILATYHLVRQHGGVPIGERIFTRESGISHHYWKGGYWRSWSALQVEAGFEANRASEKTPMKFCFADC